MKKFTLLVLTLFMLLSIHVNAQSQRLVLFEEFTQASCWPCANGNPALNAMLHAASNAAKIVPIKYQVSWPGVDPMNAQNPIPIASRVAYYNGLGVPHGIMDGNVFNDHISFFTQTMIDSRAVVPSPFTMTLTHSFNSHYDSVYVNLHITCTQATSGTLKCRIALCEKKIEFCSPPGDNGETEFTEVMRDMYPDADGTTLATAWTAGQTQNITFVKRIPAFIYDKSTLDVVAFIQNDINKEVLQAAVSFPQPIAIDARIACPGITGIQALNCGTPFTPHISLGNNGTSTLTSCLITHSVDSGVLNFLPWTGSLAQGASTDLALPTIVLEGGAHSIFVNVSQPNGGIDRNNTYDTEIATFRTEGTLGSRTPMTETFTSTTFPPLDWYVTNVDGGPVTWYRSQAGLNGSGSAIIDFYVGSGGEVDYLDAGNFDLSDGATSAQIDFDVAYCQYISENDSIEVQYSLDCRDTWTSVFNEAGTVLASGNPPINTIAFVPTNASQWHHKSASLNAVVGNQNVFVRFKATSDGGNCCYIDNINLFADVATATSSANRDKHIRLYPNPSNGKVNIALNYDDVQDVTVTIANILGDMVTTLSLKDVSSGVYQLDLAGRASGNYIVSIKTVKDVVTKRLSIIE